MVKRPVLALSIILCGLLMVVAGLGYTVNQAAHFTEEEPDHPLDLPDQRPLLPDNSGVGLPFHPDISGEEDALDSPVLTEGSMMEGKKTSGNFVFPALSLLCGAILAAIGAIALIHRWRGIGMN